MSKVPSKTGGKARYIGPSSLTRDEIRARVGGINPNTLQPDPEEKFELFEKVRKFYVLYTDGSRVREGLGEIIDWTVSYGVHELNKRLRKMYKFDLEAVADHLRDDAVLFQGYNSKKKTLSKSGKPKGSLKSVSVNTMRRREDRLPSSGAVQPTEEAIREKLLEFYKKYDPTMLEDKKRLNTVVEYALHKGIQKLNLKLQKKFQTTDCLEFPEEESELEDPRTSLKKSVTGQPGGKNTKTFSNLLREAEKNKTRKRSKTANSNGMSTQLQSPNPGMLSLAGSRIILPSVAKDLDSKTRLPPQLKLFLKMYYSCYDPVYIIRDKLQGAKLFAEDVGLEKFDVSLQTKYKESLSDFQGRVELLQDRLQNFYLTVDLKRTNDALMSVLQWTLRNGETSLNRELRLKYGVDLLTYEGEGQREEQTAPVPEGEPKF